MLVSLSKPYSQWCYSDKSMNMKVFSPHKPKDKPQHYSASEVCWCWTIVCDPANMSFRPHLSRSTSVPLPPPLLLLLYHSFAFLLNQLSLVVFFFPPPLHGMLKCWLKCRTKTWHWRVLQVRQVVPASMSQSLFQHQHVALCAVLFSIGQRLYRPVTSRVILSDNHNSSSPMSLSSLSLFAAIEGLISKTLGFFFFWLAS